MDADEHQPDHSADPREQETGGGGYAESQPAGAEDDDAQGGRDRSGGDTGSNAPSPSTDSEADRGQSTGNPDAAG